MHQGQKVVRLFRRERVLGGVEQCFQKPAQNSERRAHLMRNVCDKIASGRFKFLDLRQIAGNQ